MKKKLVYSLVLLSLTLSANTTQPKPPQSFCGYTFGEVYTGRTTLALEKPFRFCNRVSILSTVNGKRIYDISVSGSTSDFMSEDDMETELSRICELLENHFALKIEKRGKFLGYENNTFKLYAKCNHIRIIPSGKIVANFKVSITRKDIKEEDAKSQRRGVQPLPPGVGSESL